MKVERREVVFILNDYFYCLVYSRLGKLLLLFSFLVGVVLLSSGLMTMTKTMRDILAHFCTLVYFSCLRL